MSKKIIGLLSILGLAGLSLLLLNCGSSSSRPAGVLYVISQGELTVGSFAIDLNNGRLSLINSTTATGDAPLGILLDPTGKAAFVLNQGSSTISAYTVNGNGSLTKASSDIDVPTNPVAMALDSTGSFLFVVSQASPAIGVLAVQSGSTSLTLVETVPLTRVPTSVAVGAGPTGDLLYVTSNQDLVTANDNTVSEYSVDASGHPTELVGSPYTVGTDPSAALAVKSSPIGGSGGLFVYVANGSSGSGGNSLSVFAVCTVENATCSSDDVTNAKMLPVGSPVSVGLSPIAMTVDPTNTFLFVVNHDSATVSGFRINATTGVLSALTPATVSTGLGPVAVSMHSSGKFLFVSNNGASSVSAYNVDTTTGAMSTPTTVTSAAQPAGLVAK